MRDLELTDFRIGGVYLLALVLGALAACYALARFFDWVEYRKSRPPRIFRGKKYEPPMVVHVGNVNDLLASTCSGGNHEHPKEAQEGHGEVKP